MTWYHLSYRGGPLYHLSPRITEGFRRIRELKGWESSGLTRPFTECRSLIGSLKAMCPLIVR